MPVLRGDTAGAPAWCELESYAICGLPAGEEFTWRAPYDANKLVVVDGGCRVADGDAEAPLARGESVDVATGDHRVTAESDATIVTLGGHWGEECGGAGLFGVVRASELGDGGDAVDYPKHTNFDRHFHDCDEYWILVSGRGTASSENVLYEVGPGDCVATGLGHHHDFPLVEEPVTAVFFETTMRGQRRRGHLWEHTHGPAVPAYEVEGG